MAHTLGGSLHSAIDLKLLAVAAEEDEGLTTADQIDRVAKGKLQAFAGTINVNTGVYLDDVYAQNKSVAEPTAADYYGRFLIELVQNANDVQERGRHDGQIEVVLVEDEGDFGTLYVANSGRPFAYDDVVALSRIGMSTKPPGESIGNKGLGFRSVSRGRGRTRNWGSSEPVTPPQQPACSRAPWRGVRQWIARQARLRSDRKGILRVQCWEA